MSTELIAIDPGDVYTGVAFFTRDENGEWYCQDAIEMRWEEFQDAFADLIYVDRDWPRWVIYERFRLYEDKAQEQKGSEFLTAQLIGVIKFIVRVHNLHVDRHMVALEQGKMLSCELQGGICQDPNNQPYAITIHGQMADIKKPARGILRYLKIKSVAKAIARELYHGRDHIIDAELHGWKYILDTLKGKAAQ